MARSDLWSTPQNIFHYIEKNFLKDCKFGIDLCSTLENTKVKSNFILEENDLFSFSPGDFKDFGAAWMNPPYRKKSLAYTHDFSDFFKFAADVRTQSKIPVAVLVSTIISSSVIFQELVGSTPGNRQKNNAEIYFYPKRIKFIDEFGSVQNTPSFSSMIIIFRPFEDIK